MKHKTQLNLSSSTVHFPWVIVSLLVTVLWFICINTPAFKSCAATLDKAIYQHSSSKIMDRFGQLSLATSIVYFGLLLYQCMFLIFSIMHKKSQSALAIDSYIYCLLVYPVACQLAISLLFAEIILVGYYPTNVILYYFAFMAGLFGRSLHIYDMILGKIHLIDSVWMPFFISAFKSAFLLVVIPGATKWISLRASHKYALLIITMAVIIATPVIVNTVFALPWVFSWTTSGYIYAYELAATIAMAWILALFSVKMWKKVSHGGVLDDAIPHHKDATIL